MADGLDFNIGIGGSVTLGDIDASGSLDKLRKDIQRIFDEKYQLKFVAEKTSVDNFKALINSLLSGKFSISKLDITKTGAEQLQRSIRQVVNGAKYSASVSVTANTKGLVTQVRDTLSKSVIKINPDLNINARVDSSVLIGSIKEVFDANIFRIKVKPSLVSTEVETEAKKAGETVGTALKKGISDSSSEIIRQSRILSSELRSNLDLTSANIVPETTIQNVRLLIGTLKETSERLKAESQATNLSSQEKKNLEKELSRVNSAYNRLNNNLLKYNNLNKRGTLNTGGVEAGQIQQTEILVENLAKIQEGVSGIDTNNFSQVNAKIKQFEAGLRDAQVKSGLLKEEILALRQSFNNGSISVTEYNSRLNNLKTNLSTQQKLIGAYRGEIKNLNSEFNQLRFPAFTQDLLVLNFTILGVVQTFKLFSDILKGVVRDATEAQNAMFRLNAIVGSTNDPANLGISAYKDLAESFERIYKVDADQFINSAIVPLISFTKLKDPDLFKRTLETALDVSVVFKQDIKNAITQLGVALNDPERGLTRLRRIGISFSEEQVKQIKSLAAQGKLYEAQLEILKEINAETGGVGLANAQGLKGAFDGLVLAGRRLRETLFVGFTRDLAEASLAITRIIDLFNGFAGSDNVLVSVAGIIASLGTEFIAILLTIKGILFIGGKVKQVFLSLKELMIGVTTEAKAFGLTMGGWTAILVGVTLAVNKFFATINTNQDEINMSLDLFAKQTRAIKNDLENFGYNIDEVIIPARIELGVNLNQELEDRLKEGTEAVELLTAEKLKKEQRLLDIGSSVWSLYADSITGESKRIRKELDALNIAIRNSSARTTEVVQSSTDIIKEAARIDLLFPGLYDNKIATDVKLLDEASKKALEAYSNLGDDKILNSIKSTSIFNSLIKKGTKNIIDYNAVLDNLGKNAIGVAEIQNVETEAVATTNKALSAINAQIPKFIKDLSQNYDEVIKDQDRFIEEWTYRLINLSNINHEFFNKEQLRKQLRNYFAALKEDVAAKSFKAQQDQLENAVRRFTILGKKLVIPEAIANAEYSAKLDELRRSYKNLGEEVSAYDKKIDDVVVSLKSGTLNTEETKIKSTELLKVVQRFSGLIDKYRTSLDGATNSLKKQNEAIRESISTLQDRFDEQLFSNIDIKGFKDFVGESQKEIDNYEKRIEELKQKIAELGNVNISDEEALADLNQFKKELSNTETALRKLQKTRDDLDFKDLFEVASINTLQLTDGVRDLDLSFDKAVNSVTNYDKALKDLIAAGKKLNLNTKEQEKLEERVDRQLRQKQITEAAGIVKSNELFKAATDAGYSELEAAKYTTQAIFDKIKAKEDDNAADLEAINLLKAYIDELERLFGIQKKQEDLKSAIETIDYVAKKAETVLGNTSDYFWQTMKDGQADWGNFFRNEAFRLIAEISKELTSKLVKAISDSFSSNATGGFLDSIKGILGFGGEAPALAISGGGVSGFISATNEQAAIQNATNNRILKQLEALNSNVQENTFKTQESISSIKTTQLNINNTVDGDGIKTMLDTDRKTTYARYL